MTTLYLSEIKLRRDPGIAAIAPLLLAGDATGHRGAWSAFATTDSDADRDFLFRETAPGCFLALAPRPAPGNALYETRSRAWAPALAAGDALAFMLRANPTTSVRQPGERGRRVGAVAHALSALPPAERRERRAEVAHATMMRWLARQLEGAAEVTLLTVENERNVRFPRHGGGTATVEVADLSGTIRVIDPDALIARIAAGVGRGRAWGCGLMLLRRPVA